MKKRDLLRMLPTTFITLVLTSSHTFGASYDLAKVKGIETFGGSTAAKDLLSKNGFVVADPAFKQIFEAYIKSPQVEEASEKKPMGSVLPSFITTDSAWHTYHFLLEEGVREMEQVQAQRLLKFSRRLVAVTETCAQQLGPTAGDLKFLASVGLALQDAPHRQTLPHEEKLVTDGLRSGGSAPIAPPIGFPLSPPQFRAQSFYANSPGLNDYFSARQWYATVVFRLNSARETRAAIALTGLINSDPELLTLWKQLSEPFDHFLAPAEDGTLREFAVAVALVVGTNLFSVSDSQLAAIQKRLASQLPLPRISDQLLQPDQYLQFGNETRGFRLLPPRQLPCAICFHNTTDPKIPGRLYPSGLDFLAASPELRSPAALRAVQSQFGKSVGELIAKAECGAMPDSLHGEAMRLLAKLQEPLPKQVAPALRTEAWHDLQLWTQLGAWAEQRHTWALHTKLGVSYMGGITPPRGMVAPYPEFFSGLAKLTRRTAEAFRKAGLEQHFEIKAVAENLLDLFRLSQKAESSRNYAELEKLSGTLEQLGQFENRYYAKHRSDLEKSERRDAYKQLRKDLEDLAQRCSQTGQATEAETEMLRLFFDGQQNTARLLGDFAPVCDRLAELAKKSLNAEKLTEDDAGWIENYGVTLAGFHFYYGNSYEVPRDDFPIVTHIFSNPLRDSMLYAGLARPQALYVIVPTGNALQLYRGAVLTYREFVRPNDQPLEDESWRELIANGQTPPAPPFTQSFLAERSVADWMKSLRELKFDASYDEARNILWHLGSRATKNELPELLRMMVEIPEGTNTHRTERWITQVQEGAWVTNDFESSALWVSEVREGISDIVARLPWESCQADLILLLAQTNTALASAAAHIPLSRPEAIDTAALISAFAKQTPHGRRLTCVLLSRLPQQSDPTRKLLLQALRDPADGVRWQGALGIYKSGCNDTQSIAALLETLNDKNELVGAAAAYSLAKLGATNTAPALFAKLKERLPLPVIASEERSPQVLAIVKDIRGEENHADELLNVDHLTLRLERTVTQIMRQNAAKRVPSGPVDYPTHNYDLADALIEAIGDLGYPPAVNELFKLRGTDYDAEATRALAKLAPDRLTEQLLSTALDQQTDSYLRERALMMLCNISATNRVRDLIPLLDDTTPIQYSRTLPGPPMRVCDSAVRTIAILLGWEHRIGLSYLRPDHREELMARAREWAKTAP